MKLNILPIRELAGSNIPFSYTLSLSDLELYGEYPVEKAEISGVAEHKADLFLLYMSLSYTLKTECARCLKPLEIEKELDIERIMVDSVENEEELDEEELILIEDDCVDLDRIVREAVIFDTEISYLCSEDCKGLCPRCGKDLNEGECDCPPEIDERFAALAGLFESND